MKNKLFDILFVIGLCVLTAFLMRGLYDYGMQFDEVYRINNLFQHFDDVNPQKQAISYLNIGDHSIPIMLKPYISYMVVLVVLPVAFFENTFVALRTLYLVYTIMGVVVTYLVLKKFDKKVAIMSAVFIVVCPLMYPYIKFGWAHIIYAIPVGIFVLCLKKYFEKEKSIWLFLGIFVIMFYTNMQFYFMWDLVAILFALILLYPKKTFKICFKPRNLIAIVLATCLGLINYIIYNFVEGFPTLKTLWNYLFNLEKYNENPIDGKHTASFTEGLKVKWDSYVECIGPGKELYLALIVCVFIIYIIWIVYDFRNNKFQEDKLKFVPFVVTIVSFCAMIISPNSQGSHHISYIIVPLCVSLAICCGWLIEKVNKYVVISTITVLVIASVVQCNYKVNLSNVDNGSGYFSNTIQDTIEYVDENEEITDDKMVFIEWGLSSQFYFMNKGDFYSVDYTFQLMGRNDEEAYETYNYIFDKMKGDEVFIPCFAFSGQEIVIPDEKGNGIKCNVSPVVLKCINYLDANHINYEIEKMFYEEDGRAATFILQIDNFN